MSRCIWSGQTAKKLKGLNIDLEYKGQKLELFVLPEYKDKANIFFQMYQKHRTLFQRLMAMGLVLVVFSTFSGSRWTESIGWMILGATFLKFPFANRPDFQGMSLSRSIKVARVLGIAFLGLAGFIALR